MNPRLDRALLGPKARFFMFISAKKEAKKIPYCVSFKFGMYLFIGAYCFQEIATCMLREALQP